jgi:hypothetical protein
MAKSELAAVPPDARSMVVDRTVNAPPANLTNAVGALMESLKPAIGSMQPDDVSIEVDAHSDKDRSTARLRFRVYRRGNGAA